MRVPLVCVLALIASFASADLEKKDYQGQDGEDQQVQSCPALRLGADVHVQPMTCRGGGRPSGTVCHFSCGHGHRVRGPPMTVCHDDGSWLFGHREITCVDINECRFRKGGCSHKCVNTEGGFHCECPQPLVLGKDGKTCRAIGLVLNCTDHNIEVTIPKYALSDLQGDYLQLRDPACLPRENKTHYIFTTELNGCGTTRRHTKNFIVYSNKVSEKAVAQHGLITRVGEGEFNIPFCCYYLDNAIVSSVGYKPFVRELVLKEKGYGQFKLRMDFFHSKVYQSQHTWADFPVSVYLRERLFFEVSIDSIDQDLVVFAGNCCATPTRDHNKAGRFRHEIIHEGCVVDSTAQMEPSPSPHKERFSIEAFKFVGKFPFVYLHCSVIVCKVGDPNSRCAKGCIPGLHHGKPMNGPYSKRANLQQPATNQNDQKKAPIRHNRSIEKTVHVKKEKEHRYLLSKGPISLLEEEPEVVRAAPEKKQPEVQQSDDVGGKEKESPGKKEKNVTDAETKAVSTTNVLLIVLTAFTVLALVGVLYVGRKVKQAKYRGSSDYKPMQS